jgi:hypothetical protein
VDGRGGRRSWGGSRGWGWGGGALRVGPVDAEGVPRQRVPVDIREAVVC